MFSFMKRSRKSSPASKTSSPRRFRPSFEALEERTVPTVAFIPHFGVETITPGSTDHGLQSPSVDLIFSGSYWTTTDGTHNGPNEQSALLAAARRILRVCEFFVDRR